MGSLNPNGLETVLPGAGSSFSVTSRSMYQKIAQHMKVLMTPAQVLAMFAAPFNLLPALPALPANPYQQTYVIEEITITPLPGTVFAGGGVVTVQYHGGSAATSTWAATVVNSATAQPVTRHGVDVSPTVGAGIEITNATGAFTGGAGNGLEVDIAYRIIGGQA